MPNHPSFLCLVLIACAGGLEGQCSQWLGSVYPGVRGGVGCATWWDEDGAGPQPAQLVFAANGLAVSVFADGLVRWDPQSDSWSADLGSFPGSGQRIVTAVGVTAGNRLVCGTRRYPQGASPVDEVMLRIGNAWQSLGVTGLIHAFANLPSGDLVIGGQFASIGGVAARNLAKWDGVAWSEVGGGVNGAVNTVIVMPSGDLVVGGWFQTAGAVTVANLASWNGVAWTSLGGGCNGGVWSSLVSPGGDLVVGGSFSAAGGTPAACVAVWNGSAWAGLGAGFSSAATQAGPAVARLATLPNGDLVAAGDFVITSSTVSTNIARWNGNAWLPMQGGVAGRVTVVESLANGDLIAGGADLVVNVASGRAWGVARWDGSTWSALADGPDETIEALSAMPNGDLVANGWFGQQPCARWNGITWTPFGGNSAGSGSGVRAFAEWMPGDVVAGGQFFSFAGSNIPFLARWNGSAWSAMGSGVNGPVRCMLRLPNGHLLVGGSFTSAGGVAVGRLASWDGLNWSPVGAGFDGDVSALARLPDGSIVAGGWFTAAGSVPLGRIGIWNGSQWQGLGTGCNGGVEALAIGLRGELLVGGGFTIAGGVPASRVARWEAPNWSALGSGMDGRVERLLALENGDLVAAGAFATAGGVPAPVAARWDGSSWSGFGVVASVGVLALAPLPGGGFAMAGNLSRVDGVATGTFARRVSICPAAATNLASGCVASTASLVASQLPWVGGRFRVDANGLPAPCIAVQCTGFRAQALALSSALPEGAAGCLLHVVPAFVDAAYVTGGAESWSFAIPNQLSLVGMQFWHQVVHATLHANGALQSVATTSAVAATVGAL